MIRRIMISLSFFLLSGCEYQYFVAPFSLTGKSSFCQMEARRLLLGTQAHHRNGWRLPPTKRAEILREYRAAGCGTPPIAPVPETVLERP